MLSPGQQLGAEFEMKAKRESGTTECDRRVSEIKTKKESEVKKVCDVDKTLLWEGGGRCPEGGMR